MDKTTLIVIVIIFVLIVLFVIGLGIFLHSSSCKKPCVPPPCHKKHTCTSTASGSALVLSKNLSNQSRAMSFTYTDPKVKHTGGYIVHFKERALADSACVLKRVQDHQGAVGGFSTTHVFDHSMHGYAGRFHKDQLERIRNDPYVDRVEQDIVVEAVPIIDVPGAYAAGQIVPWNMTRIGLCKNTKFSGCVSSGNQNVIIYIIDTGVNKSHPDLNVDTVQSKVTGDSRTDDLNGHGTHVAGTAAAMNNAIGVIGACPGAKIRSIRVLDANGSGSLSDITAAILQAVKERQATPKTIGMAMNLSLGAFVGTTYENSMDKACDAAWDSGIFVSVAAGNSFGNAAYYSPAHALRVIAVGSYNQQGSFSNFSNWGTKVKVLAPGENILSTTNDGKTGYKSGTSMASPHVAGTAAVYYITHPSASATTVWSALSQATLVGENPQIPNAPYSSSKRSIYVAYL